MTSFHILLNNVYDSNFSYLLSSDFRSERYRMGALHTIASSSGKAFHSLSSLLEEIDTIQRGEFRSKNPVDK